jgi:hypothetical protein
MTEQPSPHWSDERIVEYIRHWATERSKCGRDGFAADQINKKYVFPAGTILGERGPQSVAKLLPLLDDENPDVRLTAASLAYEVDTRACRGVLEGLMKTLDMAGIMAWTILSLKEGPDAVPNPGTLWGIKA